MRELVLHRAGQRPTLRACAHDYVPGQGEAVVTVLAAAINPHDVRVAASLVPGNAPLRLGMEAVVERDGTAFYANRPVPPYGTIADRTLVVTDALIPVPQGLDPVTALTAGIPGLAAWFALDRAALSAGESVIVLGATGSVGQAAVQLARLRGAGHVLAVGRRTDVLARLRDRGADSVVELRGTGDAVRFAAQLPGGSADVVVDTLFGPPLAAALAVLRPGGRSVTIGASAASTSEIASSSLMGRSLLSHRNSDTSVAQKAVAFAAMAEQLRAGRLVVDTVVYALADAATAWEVHAAGAGQRAVIVP